MAAATVVLLLLGCARVPETPSNPRADLSIQAPDDKAEPAPVKTGPLDLPTNLDETRDRNVPVTFHLPERAEAAPLVIVSHGASGTRDGLYALASEIARQGYVVMCLEHVTSNLDNIRQRMRTKRLGFKAALIDSGNDLAVRKDRPLDVRFAIDLAERLNREHESLTERIDMTKIALIGHSYGAYTTMVACGVKPLHIAAELSDPRVDLGIAFSPQSGNGVFFDQDSFSEVTVPFVGISGTEDKTFDAKSADDRRDFFRLMPEGDKHLLWLHDAGHFSFSDPTGSSRKVFLPPDEEVTHALKVIVPNLLDTYLRDGPKLDEAARDELVAQSLGRKVREIEWKTR